MVGEVKIKVVSEDIRDTDAHALYTSNTGEPIIRLQKGLRGNFRHICQLHEWVHAVINMAEIHLDTDLEECLCGAFAAATLRLLKDTVACNLQPCKICATISTDLEETQ